MFDKWFSRVLVSPIALLFGIGVGIKALLYKIGLLSGVKFSIPIVNVGNLTVGGAGKTPHVEYLIRLLGPFINVATMSRGYKRKTKGFMVVRPNHTSEQVGDEPLLYARKYRNIAVTVSESRSLGVPKLLQAAPAVQAIILDDAYQHRAITPHLNILLTEFNTPFYEDWLLPVGRLREWRAAYKRADLIIVSKCPPELSEIDRRNIVAKVAPLAHQRVFFSRYKYYDPYDMWSPQNRQRINEDHEVLLICGIARTNYLLDYLHDKAGSVKMLQYEDHHVYSRFDLERIKKYYDNMSRGANRLILTTEKDAMRLAPFRKMLITEQIPIYILPIEVVFLFDQFGFDEEVKNFLLEFKV